MIKPDVKVIFHFFKERKLHDGFRPAHLIKDDYLTTGMHRYIDKTWSLSGVKGQITFISPEYYPQTLWVGKRIDMFDGCNNIGYAIVIKVYNPILLRKT